MIKKNSLHSLPWLRVALSVVFLSATTACAPINSKFSCDATAGDACLNVDEADKMASQGITLDTLQQQKNQGSQKSPTNVPVNPNETQRIWVAPYTDDNGQYHDGHYVYISLSPTVTTVNANPSGVLS